MIKNGPRNRETEDPALYRLPLITSGLYVFCAYLEILSLHSTASSNYFLSNAD